MAPSPWYLDQQAPPQGPWTSQTEALPSPQFHSNPSRFAKPKALKAPRNTDSPGLHLWPSAICTWILVATTYHPIAILGPWATGNWVCVLHCRRLVATPASTYWRSSAAKRLTELGMVWAALRPHPERWHGVVQHRHLFRLEPAATQC